MLLLLICVIRSKATTDSGARCIVVLVLVFSFSIIYNIRSGHKYAIQAKGIRLGLAVSQSLAEAKGGRNEVQIEMDKERPFTAWLPSYLTTQNREDP